MQRVDSDKLFLRDDVYGLHQDDLLAAGSDEGGMSESRFGPSAFSSLPAESSSMLAANNSFQGPRQGESADGLTDARQDISHSKSKSGLLPPMPQLQRPEHLLVTSEQGHLSNPGTDGPRPVHKAHQVPALSQLPLLNPMVGSSELFSSLPEGSAMGQFAGPLQASGPSVDGSGVLKASGGLSQSRSLPKNGNSGSERFCLERVAQQHVLDLAVDNLSPPGSPKSRDRSNGKSTRIRTTDGRGPVTQLHRGGSVPSTPHVNSRPLNASGPTDELPAASTSRLSATVSDPPSQQKSDGLQTEQATQHASHLPARPSSISMAPLTIPSPTQSIAAPCRGGSASPEPGAPLQRSALPTPGSDAHSIRSSSVMSSTKSRLRAPSGTSTSMLPSPAGEPSPSGSVMTPRSTQPALMHGSRIPRSPAELSSATATPSAVRQSPGAFQTPPSRLSPSPMYQSRLRQPSSSKSPGSMLPSRPGGVSTASKATPSPEFVAPQPRARILRGPSPSKSHSTLRTTTAELDKLAATLKQVQHDISMSLPQSTSSDAAQPELPPARSAARERGTSLRRVWETVEADVKLGKAVPARKQDAPDDSEVPDHATGDAGDVREPLAEVTNGVLLQEPPPRVPDAAEVPGRHPAPEEHAAENGKDIPHSDLAEGKAQEDTAAVPVATAVEPDAVAADAGPVDAKPGEDPGTLEAEVPVENPEADSGARPSGDSTEKARRKKKREHRKNVEKEHGKDGEKVRHKSSKGDTSSSKAKSKTASSSNKSKPKAKAKELVEPDPPVQSGSRWCCFA